MTPGTHLDGKPLTALVRLHQFGVPDGWHDMSVKGQAIALEGSLRIAEVLMPLPSPATIRPTINCGIPYAEH